MGRHPGAAQRGEYEHLMALDGLADLQQYRSRTNLSSWHLLAPQFQKHFQVQCRSQRGGQSLRSEDTSVHHRFTDEHCSKGAGCRSPAVRSVFPDPNSRHGCQPCHETAGHICKLHTLACSCACLCCYFAARAYDAA